jgi:hypothetical protein
MFIVKIISQGVKLNNNPIRCIPSYSVFSHRPNNCCTLQWPIFRAKSATVSVFN